MYPCLLYIRESKTKNPMTEKCSISHQMVESIADYPGDKPYPGRLILAFVGS